GQRRGESEPQARAGFGLGGGKIDPRPHRRARECPTRRRGGAAAGLRLPERGLRPCIIGEPMRAL
ncbi:MAG: hypothetical protein KGZ43_11240, partial [Sulfuritalea sp.]|nr:hypothetical protein [Sulfuritalea sp.]